MLKMFCVLYYSILDPNFIHILIRIKCTLISNNKFDVHPQDDGTRIPRHCGFNSNSRPLQKKTNSTSLNKTEDMRSLFRCSCVKTDYHSVMERIKISKVGV